MMISSVNLLVLAAAMSQSALAAGIATRSSSAERLRTPDSDTLQSGAIASMIPSYERFFTSLAEGPMNFLNMVAEEKAANDELLEQEKDEYDAIMEVFESLASNLAMSMSMPNTNGLPTATPIATDSVMATASPSVSTPVVEPTLAPQTSSPSLAPTPLPTVTILPPVATTGFPTDPPTPLPTRSNPETVAPTIAQATNVPTLANCPGITAEDRVQQILAILEAATGNTDLLNVATDQGKATEWILSEDEFQICPENDKLLQRWTLAVMYFATGGDDWFQCSANAAALDNNCGVENPFVGSTSFLSSSIECEWAGISCIDGCVTEIEFGKDP